MSSRIADFTTEERFRILVERSLTGVLMVQNGIVQYANQRAGWIFGYNPEEIVGRDTTELVHPEDRDYALEMRQRSHHGQGVIAPFQLRGLRKDTSIIDIEIFGGLADDATPTVVLNVLDVSARKKTDRLLSEIAAGVGSKIGEEFFTCVVGSLTGVLHVDHALIAELRPDGRLRTRAAAIDGKLVDGITYDTAGTPCKQVLSSEFCWYLEGVQQTFPDDVLLAEVGAQSYAGAPLMDESGKAMGVLVIMSRKTLVRDAATEAALRVYAERTAAELRRLRHERQVLEEKEYIANLVDTAHLLIIEVDTTGRIRLVNGAFEEATGWTRAQAVGQRIFDLLRPVPADYDATMALLTPGAPRELEARTTLRDGTERILRWRCNDVRREGRLVGTILFAADVTEQTMAKAAVARMQETMRRTERMTAMGALVAGVAHEVRNPLFGISATVDAFEEQFNNAESSPYLSALRDQLGRLNELMTELLEYSQPSVSRPVEQELAPILETACRSVRPVAEEAGVHVTCEIEDEVRVIADRPRLLQVFENLLRNAIQHSPKGGVVEIAVVVAGEFVEIAILDRGHGFSLEDLVRLFEPFYTRRRGGVGLGLALVQRIVEEHSGTIQARNRTGGGGELLVRIPAAGSRS